MKVQGFCPMGCGETLVLGDKGYVTCSFVECPKPEAATGLLYERETEHVVTLHTEGHFTIRHPLRERAGITDLESCDLHAYLVALAGPPYSPGKYRVQKDEHDNWTWSKLK